MKKLLVITICLLFVALMSGCARTVNPTPVTEAQPAELLPASTETLQTATESQPIGNPPPAQPIDATEPPMATISPSVDGKTLLETRCVVCHSLDRVTSEDGTAEKWGEIVSAMLARGAKLTEEERAILVQYLAENYKDN